VDLTIEGAGSILIQYLLISTLCIKAN